LSFENHNTTARPEEPPSSGGVSKGARLRKSTVPEGRGSCRNVAEPIEPVS
jgi:hypothetical protein